MAAPTPPWNVVEIVAALLSIAAVLAIAALWLPRLPLLRPVMVSGAVLCLASAAGAALPLAHRPSAPVAAVVHLVSAAAFLAFVLALGRQFQLAQRRRGRAAVEVADPPGLP